MKDPLYLAAEHVVSLVVMVLVFSICVGHC